MEIQTSDRCCCLGTPDSVKSKFSFKQILFWLQRGGNSHIFYINNQRKKTLKFHKLPSWNPMIDRGAYPLSPPSTNASCTSPKGNWFLTQAFHLLNWFDALELLKLDVHSSCPPLFFVLPFSLFSPVFTSKWDLYHYPVSETEIKEFLWQILR